MDSTTARELVTVYVREQFGKLLEVRDVSVARSSSGRLWVGSLYCVTSNGDIEVGTTCVNEDGQITDGLDADGLVEALSRIGPAKDSIPLSGEPHEDLQIVEDDFSDIGLDDGGGIAEQGDNELDGFFSELDYSELHAQIDSLLSSGNQEDLHKARETMPQLLVDPTGRGAVLKQMGELEVRLGNIKDGLNYLEAAACEFADRADIEALEYLAELTSRLVGREAFLNNPVKILLDQTLVRMGAVDRLEEVPAFTGLGDEELFELTGAAELIQIDTGEEILTEGAPAVMAFVIKSGVLSVRLETPDGGSLIVRSCFPGDFVGESSVLDDDDATCNASVSAQCPTILWRFKGVRLRELAHELPNIGARIDAARELHRLDSFFSMNKATDSLDARVRDWILGCIKAIRYAEAGEVLETKGDLPSAVYLVSEGCIEYRGSSGTIRIYESDAFAGLSDTLHQLPLEGDFVVMKPSRLIVFSPESLNNLAVDAPPEVVAVLERLE
ncbi:MAG: cyclic nucleotide-binding domain-containing protein [Proteobacteria bacterium]|nr:cyclic nucleotide-binding domain-containing protein [Pseudomonadota bacterium]